MTHPTVQSLGSLVRLADPGTWGDAAPEGSGNLVLRSSNIVENTLDLTDVARRAVPTKHRQSKRLADGDIVVVTSSGSPDHIGKCCLFTEQAGGTPYYFSNFTLRLRPDPNKVNPRWLFYWLTSRRGRAVLEGMNPTTSGLRNLNKRLYLEQSIQLPPLAEQRRIATILDKVDAVSRNQRERMRLLDEFLRSAFGEMFDDPINHLRIRGLPTGWELVSVESIAARTTNACAGGPFGSNLTRADYVTIAGVPVIRGINLVADRAAFREEGFVFVTDEKADELRRNVALPGDIVFTQRGTLGQVARIPLNAKYPRYIISQSQMRVTLDETVVDPTYFVHYFLSTRARADLKARTLATGVPHINLSILKGFPIVLPPLPLQRRFAVLASRFVTCRGRLESASSDAGMLASSLAQIAFGGDPTHVP